MKKCDHIIGYGEWYWETYFEGQQIVTEMDKEIDKKDHKHDDMDYTFYKLKYCGQCGEKLDEEKN